MSKMTCQANRNATVTLGLSAEQICSETFFLPEKLRDEIEYAPVTFGDSVLIFGEKRTVGASGDLTGLECTSNKWHVEAYTNGGVSTRDLVAGVMHLQKSCTRKLPLRG
jgi:hypothetical protein